MVEKIKPSKLEKVIDGVALLASAAGASLVSDSNGIMIGLAGTAYSTYHELKKFFAPNYGKPSLANYVGNVAVSWVIGGSVEYLDSKF